jgi:hypothetical protein
MIPLPKGPVQTPGSPHPCRECGEGDCYYSTLWKGWVCDTCHVITDIPWNKQ